MPEMQFGVIIFCLLSALSFFGAVLWVLGMKAGPSRRQTISFPAAFLAGAVSFSLVYVLNRLAFPVRSKLTFACNLVLLSGILIFPRLKKKVRGLRPKKTKGHPLSIEAAALEHMLELDPLNAFCFEKLSEIYEKMGKTDRALEAASKAAKLDPTADNKWRVEELKKKSR